MAMNKFLSRRSRRSFQSYNSLPIKTSEDYIPLIFYLTLILKNEKDVTETVVDMVSQIISTAGLTDKANELLSNTKQKLVRNNILKEISLDKKTEDRFVADTDIPYEYDVDRYIEMNFTISPKYSLFQLDLYRVLLTAEVPVLHEFLNKLFLYDDKVTKNGNKKISASAKRQITSIKKVEFLINKAGLSKEEALCILIKYRLNFCGDFYKVLKEYDIDQDNFIPLVMNISSSEYRKMNRPDEKLRSYGFIMEDGELSPDLVECITSNSMEPYFCEYLKPLDCSKAFDTSSFSVPSNTTKIMENLLSYQDSTSILLYGKPGSGKTEFAKALAKKTGYKVYIYKNENEITSGMSAVARLNCYLSIKQKDTIVIVDEADKLLQTISYSMFGSTPTPTKGTVNQMLENNQNKIIYIINHTQQIDESTKRRFTLSYKFDSMPLSMLTSITKSKLEPLNLSKQLEEDVLALFNKYSVTGASVNNIVKTISAFKNQEADDEVLLSCVKTVLQENSKLLDSKSSKMRETVSSSYNPSVINASVDPDKIVKMVKNAVKFSEKNNSSENGIRMLFYGISGSGKTELVRYIAQELGKKILIKRPSDIMGRYVGENEANIKAAFEEASMEDKILLFDEADSFFADRSTVDTTWERTTTNEFLTQMEEFPGILICTTNLKNIMDPAMERRFHIMVEFKPMEKEGIKILLENYFGSFSFSNSQLNELYNIGTVTPGDFGALSSRIRFMEYEDITSDYIVDELVKLQADKEWEDSSHHAIGFSI